VLLNEMWLLYVWSAEDPSTLVASAAKQDSILTSDKAMVHQCRRGQGAFSLLFLEAEVVVMYQSLEM
jgi:hypothetical protein